VGIAAVGDRIAQIGIVLIKSCLTLLFKLPRPS